MYLKSFNSLKLMKNKVEYNLSLSVFQYSSFSSNNKISVVSAIDKSSHFREKFYFFDEFSSKNFIRFMMENFLLNSSYSLLIKLGFGGLSFYMVGNQMGVVVRDSHNIEYYKNLYEIIMMKIIELVERYDISINPNTVHIIYKPINNLDPILKLDINSLSLNRSVFVKTKLSLELGVDYLPLSIDSSRLGFLVVGSLKLEYVGELIKNILNVGGVIPNILNNSELIKVSKVFIQYVKKRKVLILDIELSKYISLYLKNINTDTFFKDINSMDYKIHTYHLNDSGFVRFVFDIKTGICLCEALDIQLSDVFFRRDFKNYSLTINTLKNVPVEVSRYIKLDYIKPPRFKNTFMSNNNIGVLDVETFVNSAGLGKVYCIGYSTLDELHSGRMTSYYLGDYASLNSDLLIINCIDSMLVPKYNNYY